MAKFICKVASVSISVDNAIKFVSDKTCGAVIIFLGTVRNKNNGRRVKRVNYSAFKEMAEIEFNKICRKAINKWKVGKIAIIHRVGKLKLGDVSVVIAVSAPHRKEAYAASRFAIEALKKIAPIWKEEVYIDESHKWISNA